jgi:hypothetical protein
LSGERISKSHFGHGSQTEAVSWEPSVEVNWEAQKKLSNRIQYHLRKRLAVARAGYYYVLPQAFSFERSGYKLVEGNWICEVDAVLRSS